MKRILLLLLVSILMNSCIHIHPKFVDLDAMGKLNIGDSYQDMIVKEEFHYFENSEWILDNQGNNSKYNAVVYNNIINPGGLKGPKHAFIILVFKDEKLYFWGFIEDYLKNESIEINKIGEEVAEILKSI